MTDVYKVGIIGCSPMAIGAAPRGATDGRPVAAYSHVDGYADDVRTELVAVCDLDPAALDRFTSFWGANARKYTNSDEMLEKEQLDIVSIVTPDNRHHQIFAAAAESGVKGILCEKPIATSLEDADVIIEAARCTGVKTLINHSRRFDTRWRRPQAELATGAIGEVRHAIGVLGGPRAMLFRNGTHMINTLLWYVPSTPIWVQAAYDDAGQSYGSGYHGDGGRDPDLEPAPVATIGFADVSRAVYNANKQIANCFDVTVLGSTGSLTMRNDAAEWSHQVESLGRVRRNGPASIDSKPAISTAIDELIGLIENDADSTPYLTSARTTLSVLLAITESASQNGIRVVLDPHR